MMMIMLNNRKKIRSMRTVLALLLLILKSSYAFLNCNIKKSSFSTSKRQIRHLNAVTKEELLGAQKMIDEFLDTTNCGPVLIRLAWHDSGTFDKSVKSAWPAAGGSVASIRFKPEIEHGANKGLAGAIKILEPVKAEYPGVSYADLIQMASVRAIELAGGPKIPIRYGRLDVEHSEQCSPEGNLPDGEAGSQGMYGGSGGTCSTEDSTPYGHLRKVFYRMGLNDEEIVALSGAHTVGRAYADRSGLGKEITKFTDGSSTTNKILRKDGKEAKYNIGGSAWTDQWLQFDNSYFKIIPDTSSDPDLLKLSTDKTLFDDEGFKPFAEKFRDSQDVFFDSYVKAHMKLSELGSKFDPMDGITL